MRKPEVIIIEPHTEEVRTVDVPQYEMDYLLSKYGYIQSNEEPVENSQNNQDLTFEEMVAREEKRQMEFERKRREKLNAPRSYTFDNDRVRHTELKYSDLEINGRTMGFQVQIVSDMPINNNRR